jgi:hypothetical protein
MATAYLKTSPRRSRYLITFLCQGIKKNKTTRVDAKTFATFNFAEKKSGMIFKKSIFEIWHNKLQLVKRNFPRWFKNGKDIKFWLLPGETISWQLNTLRENLIPKPYILLTQSNEQIPQVNKTLLRPRLRLLQHLQAVEGETEAVIKFCIYVESDQFFCINMIQFHTISPESSNFLDIS